MRLIFSNRGIVSGKIYFISDVHLGAPGDGRSADAHENALIGFLRCIRDDAELLYIVGDLFDFWFEYRTAVPATGARILFEIYALVQAGVRVVYLPGNHDIWLGPYLSEQVGVELPGGPVAVTHQGVRIFIAHGDEFRSDRMFRISRRILKSPVCIALFRLLHPDLGALLARATSRVSEFRAWRRPDPSRKIFTRAAEEKFAEGFDVVVCGHYHRPFCERGGGGTLVILGDWVREDTYGVLEGGGFEVRRWR